MVKKRIEGAHDRGMEKRMVKRVVIKWPMVGVFHV